MEQLNDLISNPVVPAMAVVVILIIRDIGVFPTKKDLQECKDKCDEKFIDKALFEAEIKPMRDDLTEVKQDVKELIKRNHNGKN